jgi:hypothetical protein
MRESGEFSVYQFFPDETWEQVRSFVSAEEAVNAFMHYTTCVGAKVGTTVRVIITDGEDFTNAEWIFSKGVVYPKVEGKDT